MAAFNKDSLISQADALPDRISSPIANSHHLVLGTPLQPPFASQLEQVQFGLGCFWGAERLFWRLPGVYTTAVGYAGGYTANANYDDVCSGRTAHAEVVLVVFDPAKVSFNTLLKVFWESHDPTQGMRQGNDRGTQYRSAIYTTTESQMQIASTSLASYQRELSKAGKGAITTELRATPVFYYAEDYHQQYLVRNPNGYCGLRGTGVPCPGQD